MKQEPNEETGMNLGEALALSTAGDLVLAYLVDTGQSEDAEQLAAALKKFKAAIRQSIPQTPGAAVARFREAAAKKGDPRDAHLN